MNKNYSFRAIPAAGLRGSPGSFSAPFPHFFESPMKSHSVLSKKWGKATRKPPEPPRRIHSGSGSKMIRLFFFLLSAYAFAIRKGASPV